MKALAGLLVFGLVLTILPGCSGSSNEDKCGNVVCDDPPADVCKDSSTLVQYSGSGTCDPDTGECAYTSSERACEFGCAGGRCNSGDKVAGGWITVLEMGGANEWDTAPSVGAYFAEAPHYRRSLPHQAGLFVPQQAQEGLCTLFGETMVLLDMCSPPCAPDQSCDWGDGKPVCVNLPRHWNVGTVTIEGLKAPASITPDPYDRYLLGTQLTDLFDAGDTVTASASGGDLGPFSLQATGVADLEIASAVVEMVAGSSVTISWTPADPNSRIQVVLRGGLHDPSLPSAVIVCDAPDSDGQVEIPSSLVDAFRLRVFVIQKSSRITRFTRQVKTPFGQEIELIVGFAQGLTVVRP